MSEFEQSLIDLYGTEEVGDFVESLDYGSLERAYLIFRMVMIPDGGWGTADENEEGGNGGAYFENGTNNAWPESLACRFYDWFASPRNKREKDIALRMIWNKFADADVPEPLANLCGMEMQHIPDW